MTAAPERWLPVLDYEGLYEVSDHGRVRSLRRMTAKGARGGRPLKPWVSGRKQMYLTVSLYDLSGTEVHRTIHTLVLEAFVRPRPAGMHACHGPAGSFVNTPVNLSWGAPAQNAADKKRDGTALYGERNQLAKLTDAQVAEIRRLRAEDGLSHRALGQMFAISAGHARYLCNGGRKPPRLDASGQRIEPRGENHYRAKLKESQVREIRQRRASGESQRALAAEYGVSATLVRLISQRRSWAWLEDEEAC
jgi:DNA-binding transcriptional regulator YiaG